MPLAPNAFRLIQTDDRLAIHRVHVDDAGSVVGWDPEPVKLEVPCGAGEAARWALVGAAFGAANSTYATEPVLLYRDGRLIELAQCGGDEAAQVRDRRPALVA